MRHCLSDEEAHLLSDISYLIQRPILPFAPIYDCFVGKSSVSILTPQDHPSRNNNNRHNDTSMDEVSQRS